MFSLSKNLESFMFIERKSRKLYIFLLEKVFRIGCTGEGVGGWAEPRCGSGSTLAQVLLVTWYAIGTPSARRLGKGASPDMFRVSSAFRMKKFALKQ